MTKPAYNTSGGPVVIDDDGHTLAAGDWGDVDPDAPRVVELVAAGHLVINDESPAAAPATDTDEKPIGEPKGSRRSS